MDTKDKFEIDARIEQQTLGNPTKVLLAQIPLISHSYTPASIVNNARHLFSISNVIPESLMMLDFRQAYGVRAICGNPSIVWQLMVKVSVDDAQVSPGTDTALGDYLMVGIYDNVTSLPLGFGEVIIPGGDGSCVTMRLSQQFTSNISYQGGIYFCSSKDWVAPQTAYTFLDVQLLAYGVNR